MLWSSLFFPRFLLFPESLSAPQRLLLPPLPFRSELRKIWPIPLFPKDAVHSWNIRSSPECQSFEAFPPPPASAWSSGSRSPDHSLQTPVIHNPVYCIFRHRSYPLPPWHPLLSECTSSPASVRRTGSDPQHPRMRTYPSPRMPPDIYFEVVPVRYWRPHPVPLAPAVPPALSDTVYCREALSASYNHLRNSPL